MGGARAQVDRWQQLPAAARVDEAVEGLRLLADPTRIRLMWLLCGDEYDVGTLTDRLGLARPAVSQHLGKLRLGGLVTQRREGRRMVYRARDQHVARLLAEALDDAAHRMGDDHRADDHRADDGHGSAPH